MNLFKREKKNETRSINKNSFIENLQKNNIYINKSTIEKLPTVQESLKKICGTVATLPIELISKEKFKNTIIKDDLRTYMLNIENNHYQNSFSYKYHIIEDLLLYGSHYSYIERKASKIVGLHPIDYTTVTEKNFVDSSGIISEKYINFTLNGMLQSKSSFEVLSIHTGNSGILNSTRLLELILDYDEMLKSVIENISMPSGYLKTEGRLSQVSIDRMRESWKNLYSGSQNAGKTIILEEGLEYRPFDININNLQGIETKKSFNDDVQKLFNLYGIEDDSEYLKYCIGPIISCVENALTCQLLLSNEKSNNLQFRINCEEISRTTEKERVEAVSLAVSQGILTINEARSRLDEEPFLLDSNEEFLNLSQGVIMLKKDSKLIVPNMSTAMDIDNGEILTTPKKDTKEDS